MTDADKTSPGAMWKDAGGRVWVEMQPVLDAMLEPLVSPLLEAGRLRPGARALDVGCGAGATTRAIARQVGPSGSATGIDLSGPLVAAARAGAAREGVDNAVFIEADAQRHALPPRTFDAILSRFGVMFFDDPAAAFANLHEAAREGATLAFVAWRAAGENPFMTLPARATAHLLPPQPPPDPDAPSQFAFADADKVARILRDGGWRDVQFAPLDVETTLPAAQLPDYVTRMGPLGQQLRELDPDTRAAARQAALEALAPYVRDDAARFTCACWLATAKA